MKDKLKRKLRSNQGVTLLLSLLLFLVCVVAGSVALTAGTASSGTLSERAKLDQRYFSVTSAAELIREKFDEQTVRVRFEGTDVDTTIQYGVDWIKYGNAHTEGKFVIDQSLYLLSQQFESDPDWQQYGFVTDTLKNKADGWLATYDIKVDSADVDTNTSGLNAVVSISQERPEDPEELNFIVTSVISRKDAFGDMNPENETFSLNLKYNASVSKTGEGANATFHVNWKISTIRYAN